jgi:hypothetical protein
LDFEIRAGLHIGGCELVGNDLKGVGEWRLSAVGE